LVITNGGLASFTVLASGQGPLQYQWYSNTVNTALGTRLAGKTNSTYSFAAITAANNRFYTVVISNSLGSATSDPALLTVVTKPLITTNPQPVTVNLGGVANFSVSVIALAPRYQWYSNSVSTAIGARLAGQTNSTYSFTAVNSSNNRYYSVVITNIYGAATSSPALLTVGSLPYITLAPTGVTITNGASVTFTSTAAGPGPLTYQWLFQSNVIIAGATNTILTFSNANLPGAYSMKVANSSGAVTSSPAQLTVISRPAMLAATFDPNSGNYSFSCINVAGATNRLWASSNLASPNGWRPIVTNIMPTNGIWFFTDAHAAKTNAARFYRFSSP
ncbi:MAG TPA: immunoglobulin domain-containing protein, partial [Verrucomicrobiae bacterium]